MLQNLLGKTKSCCLAHMRSCTELPLNRDTRETASFPAVYKDAGTHLMLVSAHPIAIFNQLPSVGQNDHLAALDIREVFEYRSPHRPILRIDNV
jgi:hypothetical protein